MIRKANPSSQEAEKRVGPGRPAAFDRNQVVEGAVDLFWRNGYDGTPLDAIVDELGVSRSTLYGSFGGKDGLWASANDAYLTNLEAVMVEPLRSGTGGLADIQEFLERVGDVVLSEQLPAGCLVVNASTNAQTSAFLEQYVDMFHQGLTSALERAAGMEEIAPEAVEPMAAMLLTQVIGINIAAKAGLDAGLIRASIDAVRRSLLASTSGENL